MQKHNVKAQLKDSSLCNVFNKASLKHSKISLCTQVHLAKMLPWHIQPHWKGAVYQYRTHYAKEAWPSVMSSEIVLILAMDWVCQNMEHADSSSMFCSYQKLSYCFTQLFTFFPITHMFYSLLSCILHGCCSHFRDLFPIFFPPVFTSYAFDHWHYHAVAL